MMAMTDQKRISATVHGVVQGVSFRHYTRLEAQRLQLTGWVANHPDGTVRTVAEGDEAKLHRFVSYLHQGAPMARVTAVDAAWSEATGEFSYFSIRWISDVN